MSAHVVDDDAASSSSASEDLFGEDLFAALREVGQREDASSSEEDNEGAVARPLREIERVPIDSVSAEAFAARYSRGSRPIILTDAERFVPMHLTVDYWRREFGERTVPLEINSSRRRDVPFDAFLRFDDPALNDLYLRSVHVAELFPAAAAGIAMPKHVFGPNVLETSSMPPGSDVPAHWRHWFELFICHRACRGFPYLHRDTCHTHAYSFQVQGIKEFICFPPADEPFLYAEAASGFSNNRSAIPDVHSVDLATFPLFARATPYRARIRPGDILFVPADWWHTTRCVSATPSVTVGGNYADATNADAFLDAFADFTALRSLASRGATTL